MKRRHVIQPTPTGDAVARYERLSHTGTTWHDIMPTPADGTDGTNGAAFTWPNFNGESFVTIGNPSKLDFAGAFTICGWAFQDANPPTQGNEYVIGRDGATRNVIYTQSDNGNQISFFCWTPAFNAAQGPATTPAGQWYFTACVNEGAGGDLKIYIDGVLAGTDVGGGGVPAWGADAWEFGRPQSATTNDYFTGQIDTGRFYGRALSADEVLRDYNAGKPAHT